MKEKYGKNWKNQMGNDQFKGEKRERKRSWKKDDKYSNQSNNMSQGAIEKKPPSNVSDKEVPDSLLCPITQELMQNPLMITLCGHTFEGATITQWLKKEGKCPICKKNADTSNLQKNFALMDLISHYQ